MNPHCPICEYRIFKVQNIKSGVSNSDVERLEYLKITNEGKLTILNFKTKLDDSKIYVQANSGLNTPTWSSDLKYVGTINIWAEVVNHPPTFTS